ncbi:hypothetical protein NFI96_003622 [Prochilodus magdalenae]|nr:hypothetical protein NFI96_003622 [Prochilodus magdalenae]
MFREAATYSTTTDLEEYTSSVISYIGKCIDDVTVSKTITTRPNQKPWMTAEMRALLKARDSAFKEGDKAALRKARAKLSRAIREAKRAHGQSIHSQFRDSGDTRRMWQGIQAITNYRTIPPACDSDASLPDALNHFYTRFEAQNSVAARKTTPPPDDQVLCLTAAGVRKTLRRVNPRKAAGPDNIPARVLRECADQLTDVFTDIFNISLSSATVPTCLKATTIIPVPKKSSVSCLNDYRPIALTPIIMKCFERLVLRHIKTLLPPSLDPLQFAYRPNRSTDDAISTNPYLALTHLDNRDTYVRMLFIDFSSAFNTIIPQHLIGKLNLLGLNTSLSNWILDFLTGRPQSVRIGRNTSSTTTLSTGAPQGCVLSPLLFTLLTHDCAAMHSSNHIIKFADDTTVVGLINKNDESAYREEVQRLTDWCRTNNLSLNVDKTKEMVVDFRRTRRDHSPLHIDGSTVEIVKSTKFLGVHLAEDLTWSLNTSTITKKAQQRLYFLRRLRKAHLPPPILTTFYRGTIESILSSCITAWFGNCTASDRKSLQRVVRTAEKIIGVSLPTITDIYTTRCIRKTTSIVDDHTHPSHTLFTLLPSGKRCVLVLGNTMLKIRLLPLCMLMGMLFFGQLPKLEAQDAQGSADIVLLIDGSENIGAANFPLIRDLALRVIEGLDVGRDMTRVALVLYGADPDIKFYLNSYENKRDIQNIVQGLTFLGGAESNLGAALEQVTESILTPEAGGRAEEDVPQAVIIISAGQSTDDVSEGERALKQASVITLGVAIGESASAQLETIATDKSFVLTAPDVRTVASIGDQLLPYINGVVQRKIVIHTDFTEALAVSKRDIIFIIDSSMGATLVNAVREFIKKFIDTMPIGPDQVQIGVAMLSNTPRLEIDLNSYDSKESLISALARIKPKPSPDINLGAALDFVRTNMLTTEKGSRIQEGVPQLVLLITSKKSKDSVQQPAEALQRMGVLTMAAGSRGADEAELKQIAFDDSLVFMMKDFRMLLRNPRQIVSPLSTLSGVVITERPTEPEIEITTIQTQRVIRDIVFLVDGSSYVGEANLPHVRDFITSIVNQLDVRPERVRIGLMQFAERQKTEFYLNSHPTKQDVLANIAQLQLIGGNAVRTGAALQYALANHFQPSAGSRRNQGVQQVLVLVTGSSSQDEVKRVADQVALAGVLTFAVGADQVAENELRTVAFVPNLAYYENSFADLPRVVEQIMTPLITVVGEPAVTPVEPSPADGERDVAFLIDGSDDVRRDFEYIRDFIIKVIEPLDVSIDKVRVAVVQHSDRPTPNFYLNTYKTKEEVLLAIRGLSPAGGRSLNTGAALKFMKDTILSPSYGSRAAQNVPQFLIVLTGGKSRDSVKEPAIALKTGGVVPFGVGVKNADPKQIEAISHNPSFAFNVKEFSQLDTVPETLKRYVNLPKADLQAVLEQVHTKQPKDVVFLLDGSDDSKNGFSAIRNFVERVVEKLSVEEGKDRISVVQYSDDSTVNFYLNTYPRKEDVLSAIRALQHKGGRRDQKIGAALQFVRHQVFTSSSGSRRLQGVPQILILLSSKPSTDSVTGPAIALRDLEVVTMSIGVGNANPNEMGAVAFQPSFTHQVSAFDDLYEVEAQLVSSLKSVSRDLEDISKTEIPDIDAEAGKDKRDIIFLFDGSDLSRNGLPAIREFIRRMVENVDVDRDHVRIAVVQYSEDTLVHFDFKTHKTQKDMISAIRNLRPKGGKARNTGSALQYIKSNIFTTASGNRHQNGVPQLLIVMTGGESSDDVVAPAEDLRTFGVLSLAIGMKNAVQRELEIIAYSPRFLFNLPVFGELLTLQPEILSFIKSKMGTEPPTIIDFSLDKKIYGLLMYNAMFDDLQSIEQEIFSYMKAVPRQPRRLQLTTLDATSSSFPAMRDFVQRTVDRLNVSEGRDRVSVVQFSRDPEAHFYLNTYTTKESILNTVRGLRHKGGRPLNTGAALLYVRDNVFTASSGSRRLEGVPQILILLSGGRSFDNIDTPASSLKDLGVLTYAVGSGASDSRELQKISYDPSYAVSVTDFANLPTIQEQLFSRISTVLIEATTVSPPLIVEPEAKGRDVVFLLDGSDGTRSGFPAMKDFVLRVMDKLNVAENKDRVSVVQFSRAPETHFYLNTYASKDDIVDTVRGLRHRGGRPTNTGAALQYVRDNVFTASSGSRRLEGVPQILILLSGGRSFDNVDVPASALKDLGVVIFTIGSRGSDSRELQRISYDPTSALSVSDFSELPNVQDQLFTSVENVPVQPATASPTPTVDYDISRKDVVFLLDGSDGTRNGFPAMLDFVQKVVEKFDIEESRDRVSVVQYSRDPEVHFYLNSYSTKADVLDIIKTLRHRGGRPLNTGSALQYVRDNVFTASAGSRRQQGVPQMLILLSGSKSNDNVVVPASDLKESGVLILGVGTRNSSREVQSIVSDPSYAHSISEISDIASVHPQFVTALRSAVVAAMPATPTIIVAERRMTRRDVVFLLDGSDATRSSFPAMRDFVQRTVDRLNVSEGRDRVSVVQFSRDPEAHFYLNTYTTKESILNTVRGLRHKGGRPLNTGAALLYVRDNVFTASSGSRRLEGVPQILILLSGGRSFDNIDTPASSLKDLGVLTYAVGSGASDSRELQKISYDPSYAVSVTDFANLPTIQEQLFSRISTVLIEATTVSPPLIVEPEAKGRDVVFLLDGSDGTRSGFPAMKDFVLRVMDKLNVAENKDRVSVVQFSRAPETHFYLNTYASKDDIVDTVRGLRHRGGRPTNTGAALQYVRDNVFTASSGSRRLEGVPQILILLSGGRSFDNVDVPASALKDLGVVIFTIGSRGSDSRELQRISYDPTSALSVSDFSELPNVQDQLFTSVENVPVQPATASPTPTVDYDISRKDVVFLLDGSDGTRNGFPAMLDFVQKVVEKFDIEESRDRVSVVQYSRDPEVHFYLNTYSTKADVLDIIKTLRHRGGRPLNTGSALQYVRDNVFTASAGSRRQQGVPQMLILLSGSKSNDNVVVPASDLKESGVLILGVGTRNSSREVQSIVSDPSYAHSISEISDIASVHPQFVTALRSAVVAAMPATPTIIVAERRMTRRDVVFLLDGSDATRSSFPAMRDFVQRTVDRLNVSEGRDRVSVVQFSRDPEAHFYLNTYTTKESILNTVRGLRHKGGRPLNTGAALLYVRDNVFTASSGSRRLEGVPQILILLSGGRSFDNIDTPASSLKDLGVLTYAVGSGASDSRELQKISYDPSYAVSVTDFANLPTIQEQLFSRISTVLIEATTVSPPLIVEPEAKGRDVVFLLDGSDGTRSGFPAMKDFVLRVMDKLNVAENKDRVSVVQFSRAPETHFYLNTYASKDDIVDTVRGLRHRGGRPTNTGAALQYVRDNVFTASSGSRRLEGVPQILILLSGGRSFDNVDVPASALKDLGVVIFTIGSRGSDSRELQRISYDPTSALSVSDFSELPNVQDQLFTSVENVPVQPATASPTPTVDYDISRKDVVFLLDGSDGTRNGFPAMLDFVQKVVEKFDIEESRDRVSVVQYSRDPEVHFYLNTYSTKADVLDIIKTLRHRGGRPLNTGSALQYVRDNVFTASAGSRRQQGVPQMLILLSGSKSNDNVVVPASDLKESGVLILGVGTRNSSREVQSIVSDPSYAHSISEISDIASVHPHSLSPLSEVQL